MICIMLNCPQSVVLKFVNGSIDPLWILLRVSRSAPLIWCPYHRRHGVARRSRSTGPSGGGVCRAALPPSSQLPAPHQCTWSSSNQSPLERIIFVGKFSFFRCLLKLVDKKLNAKLYMIQILEAIFKEIKVLGKFLGLYWQSVRLHWGQQWAYSDTLVLNKNFWPEPSGNRGRSGLFLDFSCLPIFVFKATAFSQDTCNLGFKENRATSWPTGCFKLPSP